MPKVVFLLLCSSPARFRGLLRNGGSLARLATLALQHFIHLSSSTRRPPSAFKANLQTFPFAIPVEPVKAFDLLFFEHLSKE